jgi:hypothetical protein
MERAPMAQELRLQLALKLTLVRAGQQVARPRHQQLRQGAEGPRGPRPLSAPCSASSVISAATAFDISWGGPHAPDLGSP